VLQQLLQVFNACACNQFGRIKREPAEEHGQFDQRPLRGWRNAKSGFLYPTT
jgi:hypothetical protein